MIIEGASLPTTAPALERDERAAEAASDKVGI
jgi:hypothetical protein